MERVIKFRFWRGDRMILWKEFEVIYDLYYFLKKKDVVAMQFTGLHDKNGVEIYEGDILDFHEKEWGKYGFRSVVQWDAESASFDFGGGVVSDINVWRKIIGNIYENPELLKPTNV